MTQSSLSPSGPEQRGPQLDSPSGEPRGEQSGHVPVMMPEALALMSQQDSGVENPLYVDATFGGGGYTRHLLETVPAARVVALDRDPEAVPRAAALMEAFPGRLHFIAGRFGDMARLLPAHGFDQVAGVVMDIGISSFQIDQAGRGFSFMRQGPLDMRMELAGQSAADVVNTCEESDLADILYQFGEERQSRRIAREICRERRENGPIETTGRLASAVRRVVHKSRDGIDPATRTFQALRIFVNDEIGELRRGLAGAEQLLLPGGRLVVVSFHSLEDREVKQFFRQRSTDSAGGSRLLPGEQGGLPPSLELLTRKALAPTPEEARQNPRARSARLRAARRTAAPVHDSNPDTGLAGAFLPAGRPLHLAGGSR